MQTTTKTQTRQMKISEALNASNPLMNDMASSKILDLAADIREKYEDAFWKSNTDTRLVMHNMFSYTIIAHAVVAQANTMFAWPLIDVEVVSTSEELKFGFIIKSMFDEELKGLYAIDAFDDLGDAVMSEYASEHGVSFKTYEDYDNMVQIEMYFLKRPEMILKKIIVDLDENMDPVFGPIGMYVPRSKSIVSCNVSHEDKMLLQSNDKFLKCDCLECCGI